MVSASLTQISFRPEFYDDDGLVTAYCRELGLAASGASKDLASAALSATVRTYCDVLERRGVMQSTLSSTGIATHEITVDKETTEEVILVVGTGRALPA
ncbi:MAG: hypothetical protein M3P30_08940 [Chloroflexota bacterium]|nr:hypothetical protein [Chloroflexota bacterium]